MTAEEKRARLQEIFREALDLPELRLTEDFSMADCPVWDSVATVQIVLATEAAFNVRLPTEKVATLHRAGDLLALLP
jgi:acyl carrier protein